LGLPTVNYSGARGKLAVLMFGLFENGKCKLEFLKVTCARVGWWAFGKKILNLIQS
jgi:hypothetical protein